MRRRPLILDGIVGRAAVSTPDGEDPPPVVGFVNVPINVWRRFERLASWLPWAVLGSLAVIAGLLAWIALETHWARGTLESIQRIEATGGTDGH